MRIGRSVLTLLALLCLLAALAAPAAASEMPFQDLPLDQEAYAAVGWAWQEGITAGRAGTAFSPDGFVTRAELAAFLHRYAYRPVPDYRYEGVLCPGRAGKWDYAAMHWCAEQGILAVSDRAGWPKEALSRNTAVGMVWRYMQNWERRAAAGSEDALEGFSDAPTDPDSRATWSWAIGRGLLDPTAAGTLAPDAPMTRLTLLRMLYRCRAYNGPEDTRLVCEQQYHVEIRGWQRLLLETAEKALGSEWVDDAYTLGEDGVPTVIDCSGYVNWMFTASGLRPYDDLVCKALWRSDVFEHAAEAGKYEAGEDFLARIRGELKPCDLLMDHDAVSGYHVMVYLGFVRGQLCVLHSVSGGGVTYSLFSMSSGYVRRLYGVLRFQP